MTKLLQPFKAQWEARIARERLLVGGLLVLLLVAALWYGLIAPLGAWHEASRDRYVAAVERYRTVETGIAQFRAASAGAIALSGTGQPVRTIAAERAGVHGVTVARVLPGEDGRLNVWVENADAASVMAWLADLDRQYGIAASRITLEREAGGLVSAQMVLERLS